MSDDSHHCPLFAFLFSSYSSNEFQQLATQIVEVISKLPKTDILVDMIFNLLHKQEKRAKEKDRDESANDNSALNICADIVQAIVNRMVGIKASDPCMAGYIKTLHTFCLARPSLLVSSAEALQAYLHSGMQHSYCLVMSCRLSCCRDTIVVNAFACLFNVCCSFFLLLFQ